MGYHLNCLTELVFIAVSKLLLTEFGIHYRSESCGIETVMVKLLPVVSEISKLDLFQLTFVFNFLVDDNFMNWKVWALGEP